MSQYGQIVTKEAGTEILPTNEKTFPLRYIQDGPHILVYPSFWNELKIKERDNAVYHRVSQDANLLGVVNAYFNEWSGKKQGTTFTPTHLLIATWVNYRGEGSKWSQVN